MHRTFALFCLSLMFLCGCATHDRPVFPGGKAKARTAHIWLVSNGFHTSIALRAEDVTAEIRAFDPQAHYFVIGWGGREFYMHRLSKPWDYLTATLLPTASALHIIPIRTTLLRECSRSEIIEFDVVPDRLAHVRRRLSVAFRRDPRGRPVVEGPGKVPLSRFYGGSEFYLFPKTCNLWAASHLHTAGIPLTVCTAIVADNLLWQARKYGRVISQMRVHGDLL